MSSLVLARRRRKFFERTLDFLHSPPRAKNNLDFFGGSKCCHIYTFFTQLAAGEKKRVFGCKMVPYIHIFDFFWVKMLPYIHILDNVFVSKCYHMYTFWGGFGVKKCCHIYTFLEFNFPRKNEKKKNNIRSMRV
jgi:hypothetical protein